MALPQARRDPFDDRLHDVVSRPQRPGELTSIVMVNLSPETRDYLAAGSGSAKLPAALWLLLAIEGQRCLTRTAAALGRSEEFVREAADASVGARAEPPIEGAARLLRGYAEALLAGSDAAVGLVPTALPLSPSTLVAAAWSIEAAAQAITVEAWASAVAATRPLSGVAWEATAASAGQTLAEWFMYQAARRSRSVSTSAHSSARG